MDKGKNHAVDSDSLIKIGFKRPMARTLVCLNDGCEKSSFEIEMNTQLRQPEVSVALQQLRRKGFVTCREEKKDTGKGRPVKLYKLTVPLDEVVFEKVAEFENIYFGMLETVQSLTTADKGN